VMMVARTAAQLGDYDRLESALKKLTQVEPASPEAWYDLTTLQTTKHKTNEALLSLVRAISASQARLMIDPNASNLILMARHDERLAPLRSSPQWRGLIKEHATNEADAKRLEQLDRANNGQ